MYYFLIHSVFYKSPEINVSHVSHVSLPPSLRLCTEQTDTLYGANRQFIRSKVAVYTEQTRTLVIPSDSVYVAPAGVFDEEEQSKGNKILPLWQNVDKEDDLAFARRCHQTAKVMILGSHKRGLHL